MKIGLVLPSIPGYSETFILSKINILLNQGNEVSIFVNHYGESRSLQTQIPIYIQPNISRKYLLPFYLLYLLIKFPFRVIKFIQFERLSRIKWLLIIKHLIINYHILNKELDWLHFVYATIGIGRENVSRAIGAKSSVSFRGFDIGLYPHKHPNCYKLLWENIDKVHTISDDLYQSALELGLDPKTPVQKINPAIDTQFFKYKNNKSLHQPLRILTVGRLTWKKGYEYALKALSLLKDKKINFEYNIIGEGNHREAIIYAIHQLGITEHVKLKGQLSHEEVKKEMEWADIYIQPSIQEGFCNAVLEAQAMGLICIVTDAEGLSENVDHEHSGWVLPKRSYEVIADTITKILSMDNNSLDLIRKEAVNRVNNKFNIMQQSMLYKNFYI